MSNEVSLSPQALDFAPDLLGIQERPPARWPQVVLLMVVTLVALLMAWASWFRIDIVVTAEGRLLPVSLTKVVQSAESGVVADLLVREGDTVAVGQVLMHLDRRLIDTDTAALARDVELQQLTLKFIDEELADGTAQSITSTPRSPERRSSTTQAGHRTALPAYVHQQFAARRLAYQDAVGQEQEALLKAQSEWLSAQQVRTKIAHTLPTYQKAAQSYQTLVKEGFAGELMGQEKVRDLDEKEHDLRVQDANIASLSAAVGQSQRRLQALQSQYRSQLQNDRVATIAQHNKSRQDLDKSTLRGNLLAIRAPYAGIVKDLTITTQGSVIAAGTTLMTIVPQNESLQAEVMIKNEDTGFVATGQKAQLKIAAYPFQKYGLLEGQVALLGADAADPKQAVQNAQLPLSYRALVSVPEAHLKGPDGTVLPLSSGMLVTAEIAQGQRTVLEYLLSPVQQIVHEAARER